MFDFGALPPEINATRIYAGPGAAPMLAAAAAWQGLAAELNSTASAYQGAVSGLVATWRGPSAQRMAVAATPYIQWLSTTAAQAEQVATQAGTEAGAYETAHAATVPPPAIYANRAQQAALVATNVLGQNTPAIMTTEALYLEMWAQCAAAMYGYAAATQQATALPAFSQPKQNTNPAGQAQQGMAALQAGSAAATRDATAVAANTTGSGGTGTLGSVLTQAGDSVTGSVKGMTASDLVNDTLEPAFRVGGLTYYGIGMLSGLKALTSVGGLSGATQGMLGAPGVVPGLFAGMNSGAGALGSIPSPPVTASLTSATRLGGLSVPSTWSGAAPAATSALPAAGNLTSGLGGAAAPGNMAGAMPLAGAANAGRGIGDGVLRVGPRPFVMPRPLSAG
ncbi:PPE family protein [Mycobacterium sp. 1274756.6]|uniref:PPE family protein n=1 Tax=Mycobacterium sp. 1274756.6 TaxID=1834076 RepID=UPI0007FEB328|nr:PPE family protein [Mycobacterium sp. 1274756.6]OBJ71906.1 hypothetical protein A5643_06860 [Mycobacterium sp. 1274756.6]